MRETKFEKQREREKEAEAEERSRGLVFFDIVCCASLFLSQQLIELLINDRITERQQKQHNKTS